MARDLDTIGDALASILPDQDRPLAIVPLTTGFSNDTYLIEGPGLILRLPPAAGAMLDGHGVVDQARIYIALGRTPGAPPVPAIVHIEEDDRLIGSPFFVMERVPGESVNDLVMQPWFTDADDAVRTRMCRDWISVFAGLASLAPLAELGAAISPEDDVRRWQRFAVAACCPRLVAAIARLLAVPAPRSGAVAVVHGDTKLSNIMWHHHRISAVLDWEMALNGEPLADLGYMLYLFANDFHDAGRAPKLPGMLGRDAVIALWEDVTGRSAAGIVWHEIAQMAKIGAIIAEGANMLASGRSTDPKLVYFRQNLDYYLATIDAMLDAGGF